MSNALEHTASALSRAREALDHVKQLVAMTTASSQQNKLQIVQLGLAKAIRHLQELADQLEEEQLI